MKKIIILTVIAGLIVAGYYFIFSKNDSKNTGPLSSILVSEDQKYVESLTDKEIQKTVFFTLPERALIPEFGGKVFCSDKVFGFDSNVKEKIVYIYVYAYCEEYYIKNDKPVLGSGVSYPIKLIFKISKQILVYNSLVSPKNGSEYASSIKEMFPEKYATEAINGVDVLKLIPLPKTQAENYYKGKLEVYF